MCVCVCVCACVCVYVCVCVCARARACVLMRQHPDNVGSPKEEQPIPGLIKRFYPYN